MRQIKVINFYVKEVDHMSDSERKLTNLADDGYEPYLCLGSGKLYTVWAFIKKDSGNSTQKEE